MADDDGESLRKSKSSYNRPQEAFQRGQEAQLEHRFPPNPTGIIALPRGSKGAKSLYLKREGNSFGFTLRHFIVYPPDSLSEQDERHAKIGALYKPMDTIFVKKVQENSPAKRAGLKYGDRIVAVNSTSVKDKSYNQVVQLIATSPEYLHLYVVPKEEDIIQRLFSDTAYNPASNQPSYPETPYDRQTAQKILSQRIQPYEFHADLNSWRVLEELHFYHHPEYGNLTRTSAVPKGQRSIDNLDYREDHHRPKPYLAPYQQEIYAEIHPHEISQIQRSRAQPQVPLYRKMGRRASEGNTLSDKETYYDEHSGYPSLSSEPSYFQTSHNMKAIYNPNSREMLSLNYPPSANCRLSMDVGRRESTSSLASSNADGSKDSLASYDSNSTMTGHETDDSKIIERIRNSFQQKEEFLKAPYTLNNPGSKQKEFYGRPKKLDRSMWPPNELVRQESPSRSTKPNHQNLIRVKNDIDNERDLQHVQNGGGVVYNEPQQRGVKSPRDKNYHNHLENIHEASVAPAGYESIELINGSQTANEYMDERRVVHKRAKEFETGRSLPEDDPMSHRIDFTRNELSRISSKKLVPNVTERAQEYEVRANEPRRDFSGTSTSSSSTMNFKRIQRDARSLDSSDTSGNEAIKQRARSNSAESWVAALGSDDRTKPETSRRISRQDAIVAADRNKAQANEAMDVTAQPLYADLPPLIPESVERMHLTPCVSITLAPSNVQSKPIRPNQLDLEGPIRPARLKAPSANIDTPVRRSISPVNWDDKPVVVQRRPKNTNIADDESVTRRISYLKATEGGRVNFEPEHSDGEISPQQLRSGSVSGNSSNSSLERDNKAPDSPSDKDIIREGLVQCKILEIDNKRANDRSWKQVYAVLRGPFLYLYKGRHYQSPVGSSDVVDHNLSNGVDMRTSVVRVAEEYTKRENVLRVSSVKPCRSEFFLHSATSEEFGEWVKVFQEQVATTTEAEAKLDHLNTNQQAVPQSQPAVTTIQVQGSHLSPQLSKGKNSSGRNRSPTGQSPVSKTRKPSHINDPTTSPKTKTWAGRMVKQFKKIGANSPSSPTAPEVSTFGVPLEHCLPGKNKYVPRFVEVCTEIVEDKGLQTIGIYRVPGNNASITALTEEINKNYDDLPRDDQRWNDIHVVTSILKSYLRKLPDSLITLQLYPYFIKADKIEEPRMRMEELRKLVKSLPLHNYHTLKHMIEHLNKVAENSELNKMESKNLAIVFGPTIVRCESETMLSMVNDMNNQCKIVETLLTGADYFFSGGDPAEPPLVPPLAVPDPNDDIEAGNNQALLLSNISKFEAITGRDKEKNNAIFSSIISAAQRKVKRAPKVSSNSQSKEEVTTPTSPKSFSPQHYCASNDLKESTTTEGKLNMNPTTVSEMEKYSYQNRDEEFKRRVEKFKRETEAQLSRQHKYNDIGLSSSANNVNQNSRLSLKPTDMLLKTNSASNVYTRTAVADNSRNSLNSMDNSFSVQYPVKNISEHYSVNRAYGLENSNKSSDPNIVKNSAIRGNYNQTSDIVGDKNATRGALRRGSSVENINASSMDFNANANMKKVKYETEEDMNQRSGSLDSLHKQSDNDSDLLNVMTKAYDQIKQKHTHSNLLTGEDLPFVDESPDKHPNNIQSDKENIPRSNDLYKNPILHKSQYNSNFKLKEIKYKESKKDKEKDEDTATAEHVPDNERNISTHKLTLTSNTNKINSSLLTNGSKLRRSESLNKPERTVSPSTIKIKRSESLNKTGDKLKRSDSLTKNEKTESNNNKRREISTSGRRSKENTKLKRKNGMPDRSIKRRHTVGGTKDPDKVTWWDNKNQEEATSVKENKDKNLRTSSPDLSSSRRERLFLEINVVGPDMVVALRQHFIGARPQSFPESVFKVPLESHV